MEIGENLAALLFMALILGFIGLMSWLLGRD